MGARREARCPARRCSTLDALHLSTAILWSQLDPEPLVVLTADQQLRTCAQASGRQAI
jgi:hypothetical protein